VIVFLKKIFNFNRDYRYYLEKGDGFLHDERYADARDAFAEALQKLALSETPDASSQAMIHEKFVETGNRLGWLNLAEAEYALTSGNLRKAGEHLHVVMDLAEDVVLRKKAEIYFKEMDSANSPKTVDDANHSCSGCADDSGRSAQESHDMEESLAAEDRFELYIHTLPGNLPERYKSLGEKFADGCLLNQDGQGETALQVFAELSGEEENDIIAYETALIYYHGGDLINCERLLRRAIELNGLNPLCYLALVQLFGETGRVAEALPFLRHMINIELIPDQAGLLLGDAYILLEDENSAVDCYTRVLSSPGYAKDAAMKLIPLLEKQGRREDAAYLAKKFKKGCC
jgi:tetratricopeptide (TPR) repeat protein